MTSQTQGGVSTGYGYNLRNRLISVTANGITTSYGYNPDGVRVRKQVGTETPTVYLIDPANPTGYSQVLQETTGSTVTSYILGSDVIGQAVGSADPEYLLYDGHGSVRNHAAVNGSLIWFDIPNQAYNPGQPSNDTKVLSYDAWGQISNGLSGNGLYFAGEMFDPTLKMYNLRARWYNPANGRFNATDPYVGSPHDPQSLHKYLYCHGDPVNMVDPLGLFTQIFGYGVETEIQKIYAFDHPGDMYMFGKWSRLGSSNSVLFSLKPDILNLTRKRWLEIKPFTYNGIMGARDAYINYYLRFWAVGYYPEIDWKPSTSIVTVWGLPVFFWNAGGIVFYTDHSDYGEKLVKITSVAAALAFMKTPYGRQVIVGATLRYVPHMAMAAKRIDHERLNRHIGIAAMLAIGFGIM